MAVAKMKKLRLLVHRSKLDELLRELICLGCVELRATQDSVRAMGLEAELRPYSSELAGFLEKQEKLQRAIALLEGHAPAVRRLHLKRSVPEAHVLLDDTGLNFALKKAGDALALGDKLAFAATEQQRLKKLTEELKPWLELDVPLHLSETESCGIILGRLPAAGVEKLRAELEHIDEKSELFVIKEDKKLDYIGLLCMKERGEEMRAALGQKGFLPAPGTDTPGNAQQCSSDAAARLQEHAREEEHVKKLLAEESIHLEALKLAYDRVGVKIALAQAEEKLCETQCSLFMEAWLPENREAELAELFDAYGCAYDFAEPTAEEKADVPLMPESGDKAKSAAPSKLKLGFRRGRVFSPLEIRTKYYKLAE
ncbi:MAG: hypothetical protein IJV74_06675 [Clostridia bacterium]|nr:hypothetical protein [Clostridia bacterium]